MKSIIFDCDGVVLDSMALHTEVEAEAYQALGMSIQAADLVVRFSGVPQDEVSRTLSHETGIQVPPHFNTLIEVKKELAFKTRLKSIPGISEAINDLAHMPRCIASGTGVLGLQHMLTLTGLYETFAPHIYSSEMVARGKPFPDVFLHAAECIGTPPADCLVIEDGTAGVIAAKAAGMRVFGFIGGSHCTPDHTRLLKDAGAEVIFKDMRMLSDIIKERA
jgi:HAD superfamily hydrolase (TIGR01509 family)